MTPIRQIKQDYDLLVNFFWSDKGKLDRFICLPLFCVALLGYTIYVLAFVPWIEFD